MEIQTDSLRKLPIGAEYHAKSGQASVSVKRNQDTIIVYATCDSLRRMCEYYERNAAIYKEAYDNLNEEVKTELEKQSNPVKTALISFLVGVVIGILLTIIVKLKIKKI